MPRFTPARAALAVAALLLVAVGAVAALNHGGSGTKPTNGASPTLTVDPSERVTGAPTVTPSASNTFTTKPAPASGWTSGPTVVATTGATTGATAPATPRGTQTPSHSARPTPTTTSITSDMGPGGHDGDGE